jgi:hypothetical protein
VIDGIQKLIELFKLLVTWWFFVEPWEQAVRLRAGRRLKLCGPGVHFKVPFLDRVYVHNCRRMVVGCSPSTVSSRDGAVYTISATASFCIADVLRMHTSVHDPEGVVRQRITQVVADYVSAREADSITPHELSAELCRIDLGDIGLADFDVCAGNFAKAPVYRLIQDGLGGYWRADEHKMSTTRPKT